MNKGFISWVTLGAFLLYSWACTFYKVSTEPPGKAAPRDAAIIAVHLKSGDIITFGPKNPARIRGDMVVGRIIHTNLKLKKADIQSRVEGEKGELTIVMKNGKRYEVQKIYDQDSETVIVRTTGSPAFTGGVRVVGAHAEPVLMQLKKWEKEPGLISIPLVEVGFLKVRRIDETLSYLARFAAILGTITLVGYWVWASVMSGFWE